ncbi:acyl-CoA dehydrogenase family protein [Skermania piniformis]|uniref:Acyl-CoA dehydrogenase family protein n=1 Tax=Skermania pinensis TaxID=39122 RepID=A0ABX8SBQ3_9ACTN|nr:acyl-CoA dehydrogenase [Skermania piniformis]QXQ15294.1 acyl-CoA dehydrogenase family protein [Skermania piniformis]
MSEFAELHAELRAVARDVLGKAGPEPVSWDSIARAGWIGLEASEEFDGAGAGFAEAAVLFEEIGRAAARTPLPSVLALSIPALAAIQPDERRDNLFREAIAGETVPIVVLEPGFRIEDGCVHGAAEFVLDAPVADLLLILVGTAIAVVDPANVVVTETPLVDATRSVGSVAAAGAAVRALWPVPELAGLRDRAALAVACDSLGVAEAMLDATVSYAKVREQFGRPIGSFQAVKHACADMLVTVTVGRHLTAAAVRAVAEGGPDARIAVARATVYATEAAVDVAGKAMQLHGGYGYTWESGIHVYLKRATMNRALFGSCDGHGLELGCFHQSAPTAIGSAARSEPDGTRSS